VQRSAKNPGRGSAVPADVVSVHRRELDELPLSPTGDYDFLTSTGHTSAKQQATEVH
jgi:hypothetical protein